MREVQRSLGGCPSCESDIPPGATLIEYESPDGWPTTFAECPECEQVVHPV
jgi:hypothetical protein